MNRQDFEALFLDYEEGIIEPQARELLETTLANDKALADSLNRFRLVKNISDSIANEDYKASPGFRYKVLEAIEPKPSYILSLFRPVNSILLGAATVATLVLAVFISRDATVPTTEELIVAETPTILRNTSPMLIAEFASTGERLAFTPGMFSDRNSSIENLLNILGGTFPSGPQTPLGISFEVIQSPRSYDQLILRVSLTGVPNEGLSGYIAEDIKLDFEVTDENIISIQSLGDKTETIQITESGLLPVATGRRMLADQQFNSFSLITLKNPKLETFDLLNIVITYTDAHTGDKKAERIKINGKDIERNFTKASSGMQQAFWMLFKDELMPGAFDKIKPEAVQTIKPFVEDMLKDILNPNPENLERLKERLQALSPTPRPLRVPKAIRDKLTKEQLDALYPNWVEE